MDYQLVQYGCDECGALTPVMDPDSKLPKGWVVGTTFRECLCPECAKKLKQNKENYDKN